MKDVPDSKGGLLVGEERFHKWLSETKKHLLEKKVVSRRTCN